MPTDEQWNKLVRAVKQLQAKSKEHDGAIQDLWDKVNSDFEAEVKLVDEAMEKVDRNHRRMNRLEKRLEELENVG